MLAETLLKVVLSLLPKPCIAEIAATAISAAIKPYSIAVAPLVLRHIMTKNLSMGLCRMQVLTIRASMRHGLDDETFSARHFAMSNPTSRKRAMRLRLLTRRLVYRRHLVDEIGPVGKSLGIAD